MTSYSQEVISDLMSGQLPWHQTKRIMSAYKDEDRFWKVLAVHQARVTWKERILLPIGEHLFIVQKDRKQITKCDCGHEFGDCTKRDPVTTTSVNSSSAPFAGAVCDQAAGTAAAAVATANAARMAKCNLRLFPICFSLA